MTVKPVIQTYIYHSHLIPDKTHVHDNEQDVREEKVNDMIDD